MSSEYSYVCEDRSLLTPFFRRWVWEPAMALVPTSVSPNSLSILGNVCSVCALAILLVIKPEQQVLFVFPALLIFAYLCLDNMDGMHARRTGQSSPLGEFIDHWFDGFNSNFLVFGLYYSARMPAEIILGLLAVTNLAYFATFWEQRHTGRLHFGRGAQVEGVTAILIVYLGIALLGHEAITGYKIFGLVSVIEITAIWLGIAYLLTIGACIWRTRRGVGDWIPLVLLTGTALGWYFLGHVGFLPIAFLLLLAAPASGGRVVIARVLNQASQPQEAFLLGGAALALLASVAFDLEPAIQAGIGWGLVLFVLARLGYDFVTTVNALRRHFRPGEFLEWAFRRRPWRLH